MLFDGKCVVFASVSFALERNVNVRHSHIIHNTRIVYNVYYIVIQHSIPLYALAFGNIYWRSIFHHLIPDINPYLNFYANLSSTTTMGMPPKRKVNKTPDDGESYRNRAPERAQCE